MKKSFAGSLIAFAVALVLSSGGVAFAQLDMGNNPTAGSTYAVGTVKSMVSDSVTLVLESGDQMTILLGNHTVGKSFLAIGHRARITYRVNESGQAVAEVIQSGGSGEPAEAEVATTPLVSHQTDTARPRVETAPVEPSPRPADVEPEPAVARAETRPYSLPATASGMPGLALLGLLSLAGAITLRFGR
jgi:hypothetical protein